MPAGDGWIHELKHDGFRILAFKDGDTVRLWSRNGRDWSAEFVAITEAMRALPFKRVMLDGEAVAHCLDGLPDFHRLLGDGQATACFYAFDLLWLEAQDVRGLELIGPPPDAPEGAQEDRPGAALLRAPIGRAGRGDVPPRLRDGA